MTLHEVCFEHVDLLTVTDVVLSFKKRKNNEVRQDAEQGTSRKTTFPYTRSNKNTLLSDFQLRAF